MCDNISVQQTSELSRILSNYARLQTSLARISTISAGIIYTLDSGGRFAFVNDGVRVILGFEPDEIVGEHFSIIMPDGEYERVSSEFVLPKYSGVATGPEHAPRLFDERRTGARRTRNLEVRLRTREQMETDPTAGNIVGILSSEGSYDTERIQAGTPREGAFLGSQGIIYDISRYKEIEREKLELQQHLMESRRTESLGLFAGSAANDLNNKLGVLMGYAEILQSKSAETDSELSTYINSITTYAKSAAEVTSQLVAFAHEGKYQHAEVDLNALAEKVSRLIRHRVSKQARLRVVPRARHALIQGDPVMLQNAVMTLIMKMETHFKVIGDIMISTKDAALDSSFAARHGIVGNSGEYVVLTILIQGTGMQSGVHHKMEELFAGNRIWREDSMVSLTQVRESIAHHKGFVKALKEENSGIRFDIYFPRQLS